MELTPKEFKDKHGRAIRAGDILFRQIWVRRRERPGHRRVAITSMGDNEIIVPDEGRLLEPEEHWITRKVGWSGACMYADRHKFSDFQALVSHELFDENGKRIFESDASKTMNETFDSTVYVICAQ